MISVEQKLFLVKVTGVDRIRGKQRLSFISLWMVYKEYGQSLSFMALLVLLDKFINKRATVIVRKLRLLIMKQLIIIKSCLISGLLKNSIYYLIDLIGLIIFLLWMSPYFIKHKQFYKSYVIAILLQR